jgi:hypothetical protein
MIDDARALYALDPSEFVAARGRLVKELKAAGRRDEAALVAKLARPRLGEHTLNRLSHERPDVVAAFAEAVNAATAAQAAAIGTGDGAAMRSSTAALRAATATLIDAAAVLLARDDRNGPAQRDEIVTLVRSLTNDDGVRRLTAGIVGSGDAGTDELFAGAPEPFETAPKPKASAKDSAPRPSASKRAAPEGALADDPAETRRAHKAATVERARRRRVQAELDRALLTAERATREMAAARRALAAATQRVQAAESAQREADAEVEALRAELESAC